MCGLLLFSSGAQSSAQPHAALNMKMCAALAGDMEAKYNRAAVQNSYHSNTPRFTHRVITTSFADQIWPLERTPPKQAQWQPGRQRLLAVVFCRAW